MDRELEDALRGLKDAAEFAKTYRFELTGEYIALVERVESLPQNRSGAEKSSHWSGRRSRVKVFGPFDPQP